MDRSRIMFYNRRQLFNLCLILLILITLYFCIELQQRRMNREIQLMLNRQITTSGKGKVSLAQLMVDVFEPLNYTLELNVKDDHGLIPLKPPEFHCENVFQESLRILTMQNNGTKAEKMPEDMKSDYLLKGYVNLVAFLYKDGQSVMKNKYWRQSNIDMLIGDVKAGKLLPSDYGQEAYIVPKALEHFDISGKFGMVLGSQTPWIEAACLAFGARHLITLEYVTINDTGDPRIQYMHPLDLVQDWQSHVNSLDFVFTFSSIEHSGLGRYGDPLDPWGDLLEVNKVNCLLKKGGLFFLGTQSGKDTVFFDAHRQYGLLRWSLMVAGWEFLGVFTKPNDTMGDFNNYSYLLELDDYVHVIVVLRKL